MILSVSGNKSGVYQLLEPVKLSIYLCGRKPRIDVARNLFEAEFVQYSPAIARTSEGFMVLEGIQYQETWAAEGQTLLIGKNADWTLDDNTGIEWVISETPTNSIKSLS